MSNPWFVCTLWLAQYYTEIKQIDKAKEVANYNMDSLSNNGNEFDIKS
jgi:GH15 family glucan-1,4-alpha-glucosidase